MEALAAVIELPGRAARATADTTLGTLRRLFAVEVDDWGRDDGFVARMWSLAGLRWSTTVGGVEHLPRRTGALVVVNARRLALSPVLAALQVVTLGTVGRSCRAFSPPSRRRRRRRWRGSPAGPGQPPPRRR